MPDPLSIAKIPRFQLTRLKDLLIDFTLFVDDLDTQTLSEEEQIERDRLTRRALELISNE